MKGLRFGPNVAVFVLFFGVALLDAFEGRAWLRVACWLALGVVFLRADQWSHRPPSATD